MAPQVKRTYGSQSGRQDTSSSPPSHQDSSLPPLKRKRPLAESMSSQNTFLAKKQQSTLKLGSRGAQTTRAKVKAQEKQRKLTQLHFSLDTSVLRTCGLCDLSYTQGAPDDESLHKVHCLRVQRGLEWGKEEERELSKSGVEEIATSVKLRNGGKGRIICCRADVGGKIGSKLTTLTETIRLALSSPPLSQAVLGHCKFYLFLLPTTSSKASVSREKIVGCVIAQRIRTAMAIAAKDDVDEHVSPASRLQSPSRRPEGSLIPVDAASNLYVHPSPLSTPLGVPRLFVASSHRRLGIASRLLSAAASTFILGCPLDPVKGEVAFTQPTGAGKSVLESWGKGGVRIYEEEQGLGEP